MINEKDTNKCLDEFQETSNFLLFQFFSGWMCLGIDTFLLGYII
jgi:hypothetical protein